jgi:hypothetical protein
MQQGSGRGVVAGHQGSAADTQVEAEAGGSHYLAAARAGGAAAPALPSPGRRFCSGGCAGARADVRRLHAQLLLAQVAHVVREVVAEVARVLLHLPAQARDVRPHLPRRSALIMPSLMQKSPSCRGSILAADPHPDLLPNKRLCP